MSSAGIAANRLEILRIADSVAQEKSIDKSIVFKAMEEAIEKAARSRYGQEHDIRARLDLQTGETSLWRVQTVVEGEVEDHASQIDLESARRIRSDVDVGYEFREELPAFDYGRVAAQSAKQVILKKVREAERARQYEEFRDRTGQILSGIVKRVEYGHVIVDLGRAEGVIRRNDGLPRENFSPGDRVRAYLYKVSDEPRGPQIFLSRAHPDFMVALFAQEVPEVYEGIIEIKARSRDPGSRAKIGVISHDPSIDPVGACVGMRGARVQAVVGELQGERIDIIPWSPDSATFIVNALQPAEVSKVIIDDEEERAEVVVAESQFPLAVGRRGQNVRLASQLSGWQIDLTTEEQDSERRQVEFRTRTELFMSALDADEILAQLLASEGFETVEEIAFVKKEDLAAIEGFDEDIAGELQARASEYLERCLTELEEKRKALGVADDVMAIEGVTPQMAVLFGEADIVSIGDIAGLTPDELIGWRESIGGGKTRFEPGLLDKDEMSRADAELFILKARVSAGWLDQSVFDQALADMEASQVDGAGNVESEPDVAPDADRAGAADAAGRAESMFRSEKSEVN